jgi:hypothetical protein
MRTYKKPRRLSRDWAEKPCGRCGVVKKAEEFPNVRDGGTADICCECKNKAITAAAEARRARNNPQALEAERTSLYTGIAKDPIEHRRELEAIARMAETVAQKATKL